MPNLAPPSPSSQPAASTTGTQGFGFPDLLGTDGLVAVLREKIPGGLSKRTLYQWCDMGCPHIVVPGGRGKLAFVLSEVLAWLLSHRVQRQLLPEPKSARLTTPRRKVVA